MVNQPKSTKFIVLWRVQDDLENDSSSKLLGRVHVFLFRSFFRPSRGIATRTRYSFSHTEGFKATEEFLDLA